MQQRKIEITFDSQADAQDVLDIINILRDRPVLNFNIYE